MTKGELIEALESYNENVEVSFTYGKTWFFWILFVVNIVWAVYQLYLGNTNNLILTCTSIIIMSRAIT